MNSLNRFHTTYFLASRNCWGSVAPAIFQQKNTISTNLQGGLQHTTTLQTNNHGRPNVRPPCFHQDGPRAQNRLRKIREEAEAHSNSTLISSKLSRDLITHGQLRKIEKYPPAPYEQINSSKNDCSVHRKEFRGGPNEAASGSRRGLGYFFEASDILLSNNSYACKLVKFILQQRRRTSQKIRRKNCVCSVMRVLTFAVLITLAGL